MPVGGADSFECYVNKFGVLSVGIEHKKIVVMALIFATCNCLELCVLRDKPHLGILFIE